MSPARLNRSRCLWVQDLHWPKEPCIRWGSSTLAPPWEGTIFWGKWVPVLKYRDILRSSVQEQLNRLRCCLGCELRWAKAACIRWRCTQAPPGECHWTVDDVAYCPVTLTTSYSLGMCDVKQQQQGVVLWQQYYSLYKLSVSRCALYTQRGDDAGLLLLVQCHYNVQLTSVQH